MIDFSNYNAVMRRGDSESITVNPSTLMASGDTLYLTIRDELDGNILLQKTVGYAELVSGKAVFAIDPADTQGLCEGKYVWDMELKKSGGQCIHIIPPSSTDAVPKWTIKGDVTE